MWTCNSLHYSRNPRDALQKIEGCRNKPVKVQWRPFPVHRWQRTICWSPLSESWSLKLNWNVSHCHRKPKHGSFDALRSWKQLLYRNWLLQLDLNVSRWQTRRRILLPKPKWMALGWGERLEQRNYQIDNRGWYVWIRATHLDWKLVAKEVRSGDQHWSLHLLGKYLKYPRRLKNASRVPPLATLHSTKKT